MTKTLAFASYFCKIRVKVLYWSPDDELILLEYFHSITDRIFHFKIRLWFSSLLNRTIDSDIKVLNHVLLTLASDHNKQKSKTFIPNFSAKFYRLNQLIIKLAISREVSSQKSDEVSGSKRGKRKFHDVWKWKFSWLIYDSSNNVNYVVWCLQKGRPRYCWQNWICYCK